MADLGRAPRARHSSYHTADLVVSREHADLVATTLQRAGVNLTGTEHSAELGLAKLVLADERAAAARLATFVADDPRVDPDRDAGVNDGDSDLDRVLSLLRAWFAAHAAGWAPTMGKNRLLGRVVGGGKIAHGAGPAPRATELRPSPRGASPGRGVRVGVLDTRVSAQPWLAGGWASPYSAVIDGREVKDGKGSTGSLHAPAAHATFVTGLILSQAPGALVQVRNVLSEETGEADSWTVAREIVELGRVGLDVLNLSLLCYTEDAQPPLVLSAAVDRLDPEIVVVAAAGNHGDIDLTEGLDEDDRRRPAWPAALDDVVAVGAADALGAPAPFTPRDAPWIDLLALGVDLVSTFLTGRVVVDEKGTVVDFPGYASWSGTSFAAALVSGAVAARTKPGRVSARQAWEQLRHEATSRSGEPGRFLALGDVLCAGEPATATASR